MMALGAIGGIVSAAGAASSASSQSALYAYQAAVAENQSKEAAMAAAYLYTSGHAKAQEEGLKGKQQLGQIIAAEGASGLSVYGGTLSSGDSAAGVRSSARKISYLNEASTNNNMQWAGWQEIVAATDFANQAGLDMFASSVAKASEGPMVMSSLIGGFGQSFNQMTRMGASGAGGMGGGFFGSLFT